MAEKRKRPASESEPAKPVEVEPQQEEDLDLEDEPVEDLVEHFSMAGLRVLIKQAIEKDPSVAENVRHVAKIYSFGEEPVDGGGSSTGPVIGGYNPGVPQQGLNPALANQEAELQIGNFLEGLGRAPLNQVGPIPVAYGNQAVMIFGNPPWMEKGYHNTQMRQGSHNWNLPEIQQGYQNPQMGQGGHHWNPPEMQQGYQNPHMGLGGHYRNPPGMQHEYQNPHMGQGGHFWNTSGMQQGYQNPHMGQGGHYWNPPGMHQGY